MNTILFKKSNDFEKGSFCWSVNKLGRQNKCIQLRNIATGALRDIGFVNGKWDTSAILEHAAGGVATAAVLYDVTGNKNNAYVASSLQWQVTDGTIVPDWIATYNIGSGSYYYVLKPKSDRFTKNKLTVMASFAIPAGTVVDNFLCSLAQINTNIQWSLEFINGGTNKLYSYINTTSLNYGPFTMEDTIRLSTWKLDLTASTARLSRDGQVDHDATPSHIMNGDNCWFVIGGRSSATDTGAAYSGNRFRGRLKSLFITDKFVDTTKLGAKL